ncbi:MAG: hypothetical protein ACFFCS_29685, partial [Candidatus Hodarchaeota archaeon]
AGSYDSQGYLTPANAVERPREYVWEPNVTELPQNPFDPKSGVVIKGIFLPQLNELIHLIVAFILMFSIGLMTATSAFAGLYIPSFDETEKTLFPYYLAALSTSGFLIHEFAHRQVGRHYDLPAKFRLLTFGMMITIMGIMGYVFFNSPPFALPGAVVVIGLENRDQAGKCKIAGPLSNFIISLVLLPIVFLMPFEHFEYAILFLQGAYVNTFLGVFNMLPVGMLDGRNIIQWKRNYWIILMLALAGLLILEFVIMFFPEEYICLRYPGLPYCP